MAEGLVRALDEMARQDVDLLVLGREGNARFVSGAARLWLAGTRPFAPGCVVVRETGAVHLMSVTDFGVPAEIPPARLYPMSWNPANIMGAVAAIPGISGARRIGVDGLTPLIEQLFSATFPDAQLADGEAVMRAARRVKSPGEIERIRAAISVAEDALSVAVEALQPGVREVELKGVFEERMCVRGTTTPAFEGAFCVVDDDKPIRRLAYDRGLAPNPAATSIGSTSGSPYCSSTADWAGWRLSRSASRGGTDASSHHGRSSGRNAVAASADSSASQPAGSTSACAICPAPAPLSQA